MPGTAKVLVLNLTTTCFFYGKYSVSNKIVGQFFVCLSVGGVNVTSRISFLRAFC